MFFFARISLAKHFRNQNNRLTTDLQPTYNRFTTDLQPTYN